MRKLRNLLIKETIDWKIPKVVKQDSTKWFLNDAIGKLQKQKSRLLTRIKKIKRKCTKDQINRNAQLTQELQELKSEIKCTRYLIEQNVKLSVNQYWQKRIGSIQSCY